jgi:hypothetical protein
MSGGEEEGEKTVEEWVGARRTHQREGSYGQYLASARGSSSAAVPVSVTVSAIDFDGALSISQQQLPNVQNVHEEDPPADDLESDLLASIALGESTSPSTPKQSIEGGSKSADLSSASTPKQLIEADRSRSADLGLGPSGISPLARSVSSKHVLQGVLSPLVEEVSNDVLSCFFFFRMC